VSAVCDVVESRAIAGAERAAGAATFTDHRALLDAQPAVQAIVVATPTHTHRTVALDALDAGRHVFCEAPLASTVEDCRAIAAAAAAAPDRKFQVGLQSRSNPIYGRARTLVRAGSLRTLVGARAQHHRRTSWRFPAPDAALERAFNWRLDPELSIGMAGELGTHQFDVLSWFRGRPPARVLGTGDVRHYDDGRTIADTVHARLVWDDGVALDWDATLASSYGGQFVRDTAVVPRRRGHRARRRCDTTRRPGPHSGRSGARAPTALLRAGRFRAQRGGGRTGRVQCGRWRTGHDRGHRGQ
jgi:predicted dehydrogenase